MKNGVNINQVMKTNPIFLNAMLRKNEGEIVKLLKVKLSVAKQIKQNAMIIVLDQATEELKNEG